MPDLRPSYNIAPGRAVPVIRHGAAGRELVGLRWGLLPHWSDDPEIGFISGRAETAALARPFKYAFRYRRCLILADGFYLWQTVNGKKQAYFVRMKDDGMFALAGLWERWWKTGTVVESCAPLTTTANKLIAPIHERMPVIVRPEDYALWLHPELRDATRIKKMLHRWPTAGMLAYPVSSLVNNPRNDTPRCIEVLDETPTEALLFS